MSEEKDTYTGRLTGRSRSVLREASFNNHLFAVKHGYKKPIEDRCDHEAMERRRKLEESRRERELAKTIDPDSYYEDLLS